MTVRANTVPVAANLEETFRAVVLAAVMHTLHRQMQPLVPLAVMLLGLQSSVIRMQRLHLNDSRSPRVSLLLCLPSSRARMEKYRRCSLPRVMATSILGNHSLLLHV